MRLFVAVDPGAAARDAIRAALDNFPSDDIPWRWSASAAWHLTLKFLGEIPGADVVAIRAALAEVALRHAPFDLALGRFGGFPNLRAPRVLFYAVAAGAGSLTALARDVDTALVDAAGIPADARRFHPHVTVARVKESLPASVTDALAGVPALAHEPMRAGAFDLMQSRLGPRGADHSRVASFRLGS